MTEPSLSIGFVLLPDFTMLALAGFIDALRLAADEGDRSRPIDCRWTVMTEDGRAVHASNGLRVEPDLPLTDPSRFDYVAVIGGTLHKGIRAGDHLADWLRQAAARSIPLIGACTGSFVLARAGLLTGRRSCVSWFHKSDFELEFPSLEVVADQLFIEDRGRITCAGGTSVIHLASTLIERHVGEGRSEKGLRIMLEDRPRAAAAPQPQPNVPGLDQVKDVRVRRAMLLIERGLADAGRSAADIAVAVNLSARQLTRRFLAETGRTPAGFRETLRLKRAQQLLLETRLSLTEVALRCGYADAPHLSRRLKSALGRTPKSFRRAAADKKNSTLSACISTGVGES